MVQIQYNYGVKMKKATIIKVPQVRQILSECLSVIRERVENVDFV